MPTRDENDLLLIRGDHLVCMQGVDRIVYLDSDVPVLLDFLDPACPEQPWSIRPTMRMDVESAVDGIAANPDGSRGWGSSLEQAELIGPHEIP